MKSIFRIFFVFVILAAAGCQTSQQQDTVESKPLVGESSEIKPILKPDAIVQSNTNEQVVSEASKANRGLFQTNQTAQINVSEESNPTVVLFFPPDAEVTEFMSQEGTPEQQILERFEMNAAQFIGFAQQSGYSVQVVEQSVVTMLLKNSEIFRVKRNRNELLCGIVLYDGKKAPRVLDSTHEAPYYESQAKSYFGK